MPQPLDDVRFPLFADPQQAEPSGPRLFEPEDVIFGYSRAQAIEDGVLVDAATDDLAEISRQHYRFPVAMTRAVFELIDKAVNNPKWMNDWRGVWHDVLWMSICHKTRRLSESEAIFRVIITGTGRKRNHDLKVVIGPGDNAEPVVTIMLPEED